MSKSKLLHTVVAGSMALSLFGTHPVMVHAVDNQPFFFYSNGSYSESIVDIDRVDALYTKADAAHLRSLATLSMQYKKIYDAYPETLSSYDSFTQWMSSMLTPDAENTTLTDRFIETLIKMKKTEASNALKTQMADIKKQLENALTLAPENNKGRVQATIDKIASFIGGGEIDPANSEVADALKAAKALIADPKATPDVPGYVAPAPGPTEAETFRTDFADVLNKNTGNVSVDDETRVDEAIAKLATLKPDSQGELATEKQLLQDLKNKITETKKVNTEVADFRRDHGATAAKSVDSVTTQDEPAITAALDKLKTLSSDAQNQLATEKKNLEALKARVDELKAIENEVTAFRSDYRSVLDKKPETVAVEDESTVDAALAKLPTLKSESQTALATEKSHLEALKVKITELKAVNDEVVAYKNEHNTILNKTVDTVEISDESLIDAALTKLGTLSSAAQDKLTAEKDLLLKLRDRVNALKAAEDEIRAFKADHTEILAKTPANVEVDDEAKVEAALNKLTSLSPDAQKALATEKANLEAMKTKIAEIKAENAEVENFKATYREILNKTPETVAIEDEQAVQDALGALGNLSQGAQRKLESEARLLNELEIAVAEKKALAAEINAFKTTHAEVLNPDNKATFDTDLVPVDAALADWDNLSPEAKEALAQEKEYLDNFKAAVLAAQAEEAAYNAYLKDHADIINKTLDAIVRDDENAINDALNAYDQLDPAVQARLKDVHQDLLAKKAKIAELKAAKKSSKKKKLPKTGEMAVSAVPAIAGALSILAATLKKRSED